MRLWDPSISTIDGRLDTHWVNPVSEKTETWLQLQFPEPHAFSRLVVELGPHFGEFLRRWRVDTSPDAVAWTTVASTTNATPPLVGMQTDPSRLSTEMLLDPAQPARYLRLVRLGTANHPVWDLWVNWTCWGVHELAVFEDAQ